VESGPKDGAAPGVARSASPKEKAKPKPAGGGYGQQAEQARRAKLRMSVVLKKRVGGNETVQIPIPRGYT
jgi:hypothetical protein